MEMNGGFLTAVGFVIMYYILGEAQAYQNHTVGGAAGWFFDAKTHESATDYSIWAATQSFGLGDYLIFNTNTNHSIVQTYNATTYKDCNYDDSENDDTVMWRAVDPNKPNTLVRASVPLTIQGMNYFFSSAQDGIECDKGLKFGINVSVGQGLPPSLRHPPPPPYLDPSPAPADDTVIPGVTSTPTGNNSGSERRKSTAISASVFFFISLAVVLPNLY